MIHHVLKHFKKIPKSCMLWELGCCMSNEKSRKQKCSLVLRRGPKDSDSADGWRRLAYASRWDRRMRTSGALHEGKDLKTFPFLEKKSDAVTKKPVLESPKAEKLIRIDLRGHGWDRDLEPPEVLPQIADSVHSENGLPSEVSWNELEKFS